MATSKSKRRPKHLDEDRETIEAFNRTWREMGEDEADLFDDDDVRFNDDFLEEELENKAYWTWRQDERSGTW